MSIFFILATITVAGAIAAVTLRNLVHCALALTVAFAGLAATYLQLGAQFVGFAQLLIYVGAVAILVVFAILLTRGSELPGQKALSPAAGLGVVLAAAAFAVFSAIILSSKALPRESPTYPSTTVGQIGDQLMTHYILPLEVLGLLLTAALIGAVIIAMRERPPDSLTDSSTHSPLTDSLTH
jgi:NADH-quinone oxidoreductase subunit J